MRVVFFTLVFLGTLCGQARASDTASPRQALLARYAAVFVSQAGFDEAQVVALEADTRRYFYEQETAGVEDADPELLRLHSKLLIYLNFYQINIKARGRQLSDWNYYRLMLDALRAVDHRYLITDSATSQRYYDLLREAVATRFWRAVRSYQEHFPFLQWNFCERVAKGCARAQHRNGWDTIEQVAAVLNVAIDHLNSKVESLNRATDSRFLGSNATDYQQALRDYLHTYAALLAKPYGGLLLLISKQQHRKMLALPSPLSSATLAKLKSVDVETVQGLLAKTEQLFVARQEQLSLLYDSHDNRKLMRFLLKYHRQAVAEFLINHPRFFNIVNYHIDMVNNEYEVIKARVDAARRNRGFLVAGGLGLSYAALHHFFRFSKGQVLYFAALAGGLAATTYVAWQQQALVDVFALRQQVEAVHDSLVMQQSYDLLYFLHQLGQLAQVRRDALVQGGILTVYALFFVRHLRKAWGARKLQGVTPKASILATALNYHGFNLSKIGKAIEAHHDLRHLHVSERVALIDELFGNYPPWRVWREKAGTVTSMDDIDDKQFEALIKIEDNLLNIFAPSDGNIKDIRARVDASYHDNIKHDLKEIELFVHRLFAFNRHQHDIPPVR